jgi:TetR/AcrR family transcriptional regulator
MTPAPPEDARAELLACALRLFASFGYDAVGVQQIVEAAGVTKPTLYHYFGSKLGLLKTLLGENLEELQGSIDRAAVYRHDLPETLYRVAAAVFHFARSRPMVYRLHLALWFAPPQSEACQAAVEHHQRQYATMESLFRAAAGDHGNMKGRSQAYAVTFLGMLNNYISLALNGYTDLNDTLARRSVRQFMHGIFS